MPGKAGNLGANCLEPWRLSEETGKERGPAPGLATPVPRCTGAGAGAGWGPCLC